MQDSAEQNEEAERTADLTSASKSFLEAIRAQPAQAKVLYGIARENQGQPTVSGRMTLEEFVDLTVVHNRKWAEQAGANVSEVTQRELDEKHVIGLAIFMLQGLVAATRERVIGAFGGETSTSRALNAISDRIGTSAHYGLPQVTLVLEHVPDFSSLEIPNEPAAVVKIRVTPGMLFHVADGQHRREAGARVRSFLSDVVRDRRTPKGTKLFPAEDAPLTTEYLDAWVAVQETFRSWTCVAYEAHVGIDVRQARQLFTNFNAFVKPVKTEQNLDFDTSNPINLWTKEWLVHRLPSSNGTPFLDLRQLASINAQLFLGKTSIKNAPFDISHAIPRAKEFWEMILSAPDFARDGTLLRDVPVLKGLAKTWYLIRLAKRNNRMQRAPMFVNEISTKTFDENWIDSVPGLRSHVISQQGEPVRFTPSHNDVVTTIVAYLAGK